MASLLFVVTLGMLTFVNVGTASSVLADKRVTNVEVESSSAAKDDWNRPRHRGTEGQRALLRTVELRRHAALHHQSKSASRRTTTLARLYE